MNRVRSITIWHGLIIFNLIITGAALFVGTLAFTSNRDLIDTNYRLITRNKNLALQVRQMARNRTYDLCVAANKEHAIIRNALIASLTEVDVQANKPQREAYEKIVRRFAHPKDC